MILSASRRTDIPGYYSEWFLSRLKEGYLYVRNPMNPHQVSKITLSPEEIDCIVFWTKNPAPMLSRLDGLGAYPYYFQFTLTGFGNDIERSVPHKKKYILPVFQELSRKTGPERVIWRYDPIFFTEKYTPEYHLKAFGQIARELCGCTSKCVISFLDMYTKIRKNMDTLNPLSLTEDELTAFCREMVSIAGAYGIKAATCAEVMDLSACGIAHNSCIDKELIERITGRSLRIGRDKNQRKACGCAVSVDVGTYNTCRNGCLYCYANYSPESVSRNCRFYDAASPLLCGKVNADDRITERKL